MCLRCRLCGCGGAGRRCEVGDALCLLFFLDFDFVFWCVAFFYSTPCPALPNSPHTHTLTHVHFPDCHFYANPLPPESNTITPQPSCAITPPPSCTIIFTDFWEKPCPDVEAPRVHLSPLRLSMGIGAPLGPEVSDYFKSFWATSEFRK